MKTKDLYNSISAELQSIYPKYEANNIAFELLEEILGTTQTDIIVNKELHEVDYQSIDKALNRLIDNEPLQYVLGKASFFGREFKVNKEVLIPRNETEELVHLIVQENPRPGIRLLDIGTGSGCIPVTLFHELDKPEIEALDVSTKALNIAKENAHRLNASIIFHFQNVLSDKPLPSTYDVIVSNPPYVTQAEKSSMKKNVLDYEPHIALFVENDDPLIFYSVIAQKANDSLNTGGKLYFEINENLGQEVAAEMKKTGFTDISIIKDLNNKNRIVSGKLK